ncbi:MAG TPA: NRDE family protein [Acidimicrobiales bacterium]
MCLLVVAFQLVPDAPLIVGANRDEVLERPSTALTVLHPGPPRVLGGRDELSGGTWLAVNERGVFAGLTNQPLGEAKDPSKRSRGELPVALARHETATAAVRAFLSRFRPEDYNGSWLLVGDRSSLFFIDFTGLVEPAAVALPPGLHVLENKPLGDPSPKVDLVVDAVGTPAGGEEVLAAFRAVLGDHRIPEGDERANSANCVHLDGFGTRSSCLVRVGSEPATVPELWVAEGPPCTAPLEDAGALWSADAASVQSRTRGL